MSAILFHPNVLTHSGQDKMDAISQMALSNTFSWMTMLEFWVKFHWSLFLRDQLIVFLHWFRKWLGADQATSHYLNQWWLDYRRIYASLGLNELRGEANSSLIASLGTVHTGICNALFKGSSVAMDTKNTSNFQKLLLEEWLINIRHLNFSVNKFQLTYLALNLNIRFMELSHGTHPTNDIWIKFEIQWNFMMFLFISYSVDRVVMCAKFLCYWF